MALPSRRVRIAGLLVTAALIVKREAARLFGCLCARVGSARVGTGSETTRRPRNPGRNRVIQSERNRPVTAF